MKKRSLSREERNFLLLLGLPSFGLALAYTLVTTYLPYFIEKQSGAAITGILVGCEGLFALTVPLFVGIWSDSISTPYGKRLPFFITGVFIVSFALVAMPYSSESLLLLGAYLFLFFIGYFTLYSAYYAFFPDLVGDEIRGRSQGIQGAFRSLGLLLAISGGGILMQWYEPLPFLLFTCILIVVATIFTVGIFKKIEVSDKSGRVDWYSGWNLIKNHEKIKLWVIANTLWESAVGALRVFVVLYFTKGLSISLAETSAALGLVGISAVVAAPVAGKLADEYGHKPVILASIILFGVGLFPALFTVNKYFIWCILPVAFSAVVLMTLPFSLLMGYLPDEKQHGAGVALFGFCQGIGAVIGPLLAGIAVECSKHLRFLEFEKTHGYVAIFLVASLFLFASVPFSVRLFKRGESPSQ